MDTMNWKALDSLGRLQTATYRFSGGVSRTTLLRIDDQHVVVYSPGASLVNSAHTLLGDDLEVLLVSPSAGHTMGIDPWLERFPSARVFAAESAIARLCRVTAASHVEPPSELSAILPAHIGLHTPPTSRTGELWLSAELEDRIYWAVCDSFMNIAKLADGFWLRLAQRLYGLRVGLSVGRVFRIGLEDPATFRDWVVSRFSNERRNVLVPCHGEVDESHDLTERIIALTQATF